MLPSSKTFPQKVKQPNNQTTIKKGKENINIMPFIFKWYLPKPNKKQAIKLPKNAVTKALKQNLVNLLFAEYIFLFTIDLYHNEKALDLLNF